MKTRENTGNTRKFWRIDFVYQRENETFISVGWHLTTTYEDVKELHAFEIDPRVILMQRKGFVVDWRVSKLSVATYKNFSNKRGSSLRTAYSLDGIVFNFTADIPSNAKYFTFNTSKGIKEEFLNLEI